MRDNATAVPVNAKPDEFKLSDWQEWHTTTHRISFKLTDCQADYIFEPKLEDVFNFLASTSSGKMVVTHDMVTTIRTRRVFKL